MKLELQQIQIRNICCRTVFYGTLRGLMALNVESTYEGKELK